MSGTVKMAKKRGASSQSAPKGQPSAKKAKREPKKSTAKAQSKKKSTPKKKSTAKAEPMKKSTPKAEPVNKSTPKKKSTPKAEPMKKSTPKVLPKRKSIPKAQKSASKRRSSGNSSNPACIFCQSNQLTTATGYAHHLSKYHNTTLKKNGIYLVCGCGTEVRTRSVDPNHKDCDNATFTLHHETKDTPQCTICSSYPSTCTGYANHMVRAHKSSLTLLNLYLVCACGKKVCSHRMKYKHTNQCNGLKFTLHNLADDEEEEENEGEEEIEDENDVKEAAGDDEEQMGVEDEEEERAENGHEDIDEEEEEGENDEEMEAADDTVEMEDGEGHGEESMDEESEERLNEDEDVDVETVGSAEPHSDEEDDVHVDPEFVPVHYAATIGAVIDKKYKVKRKLGSGRFSIVWLCEEAAMNRSVAIKIGCSNEDMQVAAMDEISLLNCISNADASDPHRDKVVQLLNSFTYSSRATGDHLCFVFEPLECNLLKLIRKSNYTGIGVEKVKTVVRQVLQGLDFLHTKCQIIHTDIKPENILVAMENDEVKQVKIADLGNGCYTYHHYMDQIQTREYRSPEVMLLADYNSSADIWSAACMAFECATGDYLFKPSEGTDENGEPYSMDADHLALITRMLGPIPSDVYKTGAHWAEFFDEEGGLLHVDSVESRPLSEELLVRGYGWSVDDAVQFASLLEPMLELDHQKRATAAACLQHEWLQPLDERSAPAAAVKEEEAAAAAVKEEEDAAAAVKEEEDAAAAVKEEEDAAVDGTPAPADAAAAVKEEETAAAASEGEETAAKAAKTE